VLHGFEVLFLWVKIIFVDRYLTIGFPEFFGIGDLIGDLIELLIVVFICHYSVHRIGL